MERVFLAITEHSPIWIEDEANARLACQSAEERQTITFGHACISISMNDQNGTFSSFFLNKRMSADRNDSSDKIGMIFRESLDSYSAGRVTVKEECRHT